MGKGRHETYEKQRQGRDHHRLFHGANSHLFYAQLEFSDKLELIIKGVGVEILQKIETEDVGTRSDIKACIASHLPTSFGLNVERDHVI